MKNTRPILEAFVIGGMVFAAAITIYLVDGCVNYQASIPETPEEVYLKARMTFNSLLEDYIDQKRRADNATRAKWSNDIDPWFERGAAVLDGWGDSLKAGTGTHDQQQAYLEIKNQLLQIMLKELTK